MDSEGFLNWHNGGMGRILGIEFTSASPTHVVARARISPEHLTRPDVVHGGLVMTLADCAGAYGAVLNLPGPGKTTATIESKTNFLKRGRGAELLAEAVPIHVGSKLSVWRTSVFRGGREPIAEVTQTQIVLDEPAGEHDILRRQTPASAAKVAVLPSKASARNFRKAVVDERQRQIFDGACRVIAAKGFDKATIREIAAAANMPIPTMYQYVERKEDILFKIYENFMSEFLDSLERTRRADAPVDRRIERAIATMIGDFDKKHKYIKVMFQETRSLTPAARRLVYDLDARYISILKSLLDEGVKAGQLQAQNTELAANFIYFLCVIWPLRYWSIGKFGQDKAAKEILDFALRGLGASWNRKRQEKRTA